MNQRLLAFLLLGVSTACRATAAAPAAVSEPAPDRYVHRVVVRGVPPGARSVRLEVSVLAPIPAGALRDLHAAVLVGNAAFELALAPGTAVEVEQAGLSLNWSEAGVLVLETGGKAVELGLSLALAPSGADGVAALERELAAGTRAQVDSQSWDGVRTRFERLR